jgi:uncharacterized phage-like protein YoqJ
MDKYYQKVIRQIDQIRNIFKIQEFLNRQFKRKKAFLKEKNEKQGILELVVYEEEDEKSKS